MKGFLGVVAISAMLLLPAPQAFGARPHETTDEHEATALTPYLLDLPESQDTQRCVEVNEEGGDNLGAGLDCKSVRLDILITLPEALRERAAEVQP